MLQFIHTNSGDLGFLESIITDKHVDAVLIFEIDFSLFECVLYVGLMIWGVYIQFRVLKCVVFGFFLLVRNSMSTCFIVCD